MPASQSVKELEPRPAAAQGPPGRKETLFEALQERRRRVQAELEAISRKLRGEGDPENGQEKIGTVGGFGREFGLARMNQLAQYLEQIDEALSQPIDGRRRTGPSEGVQAHARYRVGLLVSVEAAEGPVLKGRTLNLSNSGVALMLARRIPPGTIVRTTMHLRWGDIPLTGTVVWSDEASPTGSFGYRHGIRFRKDQPGTFAIDIFTAERVAGDQ